MDQLQGKNLDIRTVKTIEAVYNGFLTLMKKKAFRDISVKMICEEARISRSTFYDHFEDKYHLLTCLLRDISADVAKDYVYFTGVSPATASVTVLQENYKELLREILLNRENYGLYEIYKDVMATDIREKICTRRPDIGKDAPWLEYIADFYASGILAVLTRWVSGKTKATGEDINGYMHILLDGLHEDSDRLFAQEKK